jgi:AcrR family transcriptional regulator
LENSETQIREAVSQLAATMPVGQIKLSRVAELAGISAPTVRKYVKGKQGLRSFMARHNIVASHDGQETPELILEAARRVFAERGYDGATMDHIAAAANMTKGAVYHHFKNKKDLFWILSERRLNQQMNLANAAALPEGTTAEQGLLLLFKGVLEGLVAEPGWTRLHFEILSRTRDPDTAKLFQRHDDYLINRIALDIAAAQKNDEYRADIAPEAMAFLITAVVARLSQYTVLGVDESTVASLLPDIARILVSGSGSRGV